MRFVVTYVRQSRYSRRRVGKSATQMIDTATAYSTFSSCTTSEQIERAFEKLYEDDKSVSVKVVDVRLVLEEVVQ